MLLRSIQILLIIVLLFCPILSLADVIYLKDGRSFKGEVISETDEIVKVKERFGSGSVESDYLKSNIERIERQSLEQKKHPSKKPKSKPKPEYKKSRNTKSSQATSTASNSVVRMAQLLIILRTKCDTSDEDIPYIIERGQILLRKKAGKDVNVVELMEALNMVIPDGLTGMDCRAMMDVVITEYQNKR